MSVTQVMTMYNHNLFTEVNHDHPTNNYYITITRAGRRQIEIWALLFLFFMSRLALTHTWYMQDDFNSNQQRWQIRLLNSGSFEQLKEFTIYVKKGISESLKKRQYNHTYFVFKHFCLIWTCSQSNLLNGTMMVDLVILFACTGNLNKFDQGKCWTMMCTGNN